MKKQREKTIPMYYSEYSSTDDLPVVPFPEDDWVIRDRSVSFFHCHNCLEITYCRKGELTFMIEREEKTVGEGEICVICRNTMHGSFVKSETPAYCNYLYVDLDKFREAYPMRIEDLDELKFHSYRFVNVIATPVCGELLMRIFRELQDRQRNYRANVLALTGILLTEILRAQELSPQSVPAIHDGRFPIADSVDYMNAHYSRALATEELADVCHMSPAHYRRVFKKLMGLSPMLYLNRIRVERACELLYSTNDTVLNISETVGFKTISSMNRNFKMFMGIAPLQWRNQTRGTR